MPRPLYPSFPFPFYRNFHNPQAHLYNSSRPNSNSNSYNVKDTVSHNLQREPQKFSSFESAPKHIESDENNNDRNFKEKNKSNKNDNYLFDLFGLKIYFDDVLLVSIIYFLYSEGVKDDNLFLVLILLLLS